MESQRARVVKTVASHFSLSHIHMTFAAYIPHSSPTHATSLTLTLLTTSLALPRLTPHLSLFSSCRVEVGSRKNAEKIPLQGIFTGAKVQRGPDWDWGNQDGGEGECALPPPAPQPTSLVCNTVVEEVDYMQNRKCKKFPQFTSLFKVCSSSCSSSA